MKEYRIGKDKVTTICAVHSAIEKMYDSVIETIGYTQRTTLSEEDFKDAISDIENALYYFPDALGVAREMGQNMEDAIKERNEKLGELI